MFTLKRDQKLKHRLAGRWFAYRMVSAVALAMFLSLIGPYTAVMAFPGQLDTSYGVNGSVVFPSILQTTQQRAAIQPDGKVVVAYTVVDQDKFSVIVQRFLPNGQNDTVGEWPTLLAAMQGPGGQLGFILPLKVLIRPDGKVLVAYTRLSYPGPDTSYVAVLNLNGTLQTTFTTDMTYPGFTSAADFAVLLDNRLIMITPGGSLKSFDANGSLISEVPVWPPAAIPQFQYQRLAVDREGRILISGAASGNTLLTRYNSDLTVDSSFCGGLPCSYEGTVREIEIANHGRIVTMEQRRITRYLSDGSLDISFGLAGHFSTRDVTRSLKIDSLGRIVVVLEGTDSENRMWVIEADGSMSEMLHAPGFAGTGRFFFQEDGKLIVVVGSNAAGHTQTPLVAKLVRLHYEDEGKSADLRIETIRVNPERSVSPGDVITFWIRVTNSGRHKAGHLTFENSLPDGTTFLSFEEPEGWVTYRQPRYIFGNVSCSGYSLAAGQSVTFRLRLQVNAFGHFSTISNTATIRSLVFDPRPSDNITHTTVPVH